MLNTLVENFGKSLDINELITTKTPGEYTIAFDTANVITIKQCEGEVYLVSCTIAPCPKQNLDAFYTLLLESNLFGQATLGSILGLNEDGSLLTLSLELDYNTNDKEFREKIEDFLNIADFWRKKVVEFSGK